MTPRGLVLKSWAILLWATSYSTYTSPSVHSCLAGCPLRFAGDGLGLGALRRVPRHPRMRGRGPHLPGDLHLLPALARFLKTALFNEYTSADSGSEDRCIHDGSAPSWQRVAVKDQLREWCQGALCAWRAACKARRKRQCGDCTACHRATWGDVDLRAQGTRCGEGTGNESKCQPSGR